MYFYKNLSPGAVLIGCTSIFHGQKWNLSVVAQNSNLFIAKTLCWKHSNKKIRLFMSGPLSLCGWASCSDLFHKILVLTLAAPLKFTIESHHIWPKAFMCCSFKQYYCKANPLFLFGTRYWSTHNTSVQNWEAAVHRLPKASDNCSVLHFQLFG